MQHAKIIFIHINNINKNWKKIIGQWRSIYLKANFIFRKKSYYAKLPYKIRTKSYI